MATQDPRSPSRQTGDVTTNPEGHRKYWLQDLEGTHRMTDEVQGQREIDGRLDLRDFFRLNVTAAVGGTQKMKTLIASWGGDGFQKGLLNQLFGVAGAGHSKWVKLSLDTRGSDAGETWGPGG
jgi:hypothetical protein